MGPIFQDINTSEDVTRDTSITEDTDGSNQHESMQDLREKIIQLENEKSEQQNHIALLNKKVAMCYSFFDNP